MEAAGLAIGIVALVGTFKDCIDLFSLINTARHLGRDYSILDTKLDIEKAILLQWAERVRLLKPDYDERLDDQVIGRSVTSILAQIHSLLGESTALRDRYGLERTEGTAAPSGSVSGPVSGRRYKAFVQDFQSLTLHASQRKASPLARVRWTIKDKDQFGVLIQDLSYFVAKLNQLIPDLPGSFSDIMKKYFELGRTSPQNLKLIIEAASEQSPEVAGAAKKSMEKIFERRILKQLSFPEIAFRQRAILPQHAKTFEWALAPRGDDTQKRSLWEWLLRGSGVFWLRGKAGSGKSTMMKFLYRDQRTWSRLSVWAGGETCHGICYFFWRLGTDEQKSHMGLFRAVLYQILKSDPSLSQRLVPRMWEEASSRDGDYDDNDDNDNDSIDIPTLEEMRLFPVALAAWERRAYLSMA